MLGIPEGGMQHYGKGPLLSAKEQDREVCWHRAQQVQELCTQVSAQGTAPAHKVHAGVALAPERQICWTARCASHASGSCTPAQPLSLVAGRALPARSGRSHSQTSSCRLRMVWRGASVGDRAAHWGGVLRITAHDAHPAHVQESEYVMLHIDAANRGGLTANFEGVAVFIPFSRIPRESSAGILTQDVLPVAALGHPCTAGVA